MQGLSATACDIGDPDLDRAGRARAARVLSKQRSGFWHPLLE